MTLSDASAKCTDDLVATVTTTDGTMYITDSNPPVAPNMSVGTWSVRVTSGSNFRVPIGRTSDSEMKEVTVSVEWDPKLLTYRGAADAVAETKVSSTSRRLTFATKGLYSTNYMDFTAANISGLKSESWVRMTAASGMGVNNLAAKVVNKLPVTSPVLIVREIGRYSPGDIDGDGKLTEADLDMLKNYIKYLSIVNSMPSLAGRYASWKLTGNALKAADVNIDNKWDANDVSLLAQWVAEYKEIGK
jgi:hypothetical protein